jgi:hypothetical protein
MEDGVLCSDHSNQKRQKKKGAGHNADGPSIASRSIVEKSLLHSFDPAEPAGFQNTVPKIVPSACLDALSGQVGRSAETPIFTSECEHIQTALNC